MQARIFPPPCPLFKHGKTADLVLQAYHPLELKTRKRSDSVDVTHRETTLGIGSWFGKGLNVCV
jgi:hypothetical protein